MLNRSVSIDKGDELEDDIEHIHHVKFRKRKSVKFDNVNQMGVGATLLHRRPSRIQKIKQVLLPPELQDVELTPMQLVDFKMEYQLRHKVDEDMKRKPREEVDVTMVTLLQPAEMLKAELILHESARTNNLEKVKELISKKVDVNSKNNLDRTALHWAAANGHLDIMKALLKARAEIEAADKYGMKALLWAAWFGHLEAVKLLTNKGCDIHCRNRQGLNMLHCASQNAHDDILQFIFDTLEGFKVNAVENNDRTALHLAAEQGHFETIDKLITAKCDVTLKDKSGQTAIHKAAANGHQEVLKKVLLIGIEIDDRDNDGQTPLYVAAAGGHVGACETLLSNNADPNIPNTKGLVPIHIAAQNGHRDVIKVLLDYNSEKDAKNHQGNTAVHLAALGDHPDVVRQLIDAYANLEIHNQRMQTPLHAAVEEGLADVVEVLLIAGADLHATEKTGRTALNLASRASFIGIVDMIIKADRFHDLFETDGKLSIGNNNIQLKRPDHDCTEYMKDVLWRLATKQLNKTDWKRLALYWKFNESHIKAIEHQYTGPNSYKEHGYRLLLIWLHGVKRDENPMKPLFEAIVGIDRRELAEQIRKKANIDMEKGGQGSCTIS